MSDQPTFLALLRAHEVPLRAYVGTLIRDAHAREDVLQDISLALWRAFPRYDAARPFGAWARGVATRQVLKALRDGRRIPCPFPPDTIELIQQRFDELEQEASARHVALRHCAAQLPDRAQQILSLRYVEDLPCGEIATRLGMTVDAVHQSLSRLRAQLGECIARRLQLESQLTLQHEH